MPRSVDLKRLRVRSLEGLAEATRWYDFVVTRDYHYGLARWAATMVAVQVHAVWERFAERRLVSALNHKPGFFLLENNVYGVTRIPVGLADYLVRGGGRYFNFRSTSELVDRANRLVGNLNNPFQKILPSDRKYLDTLAAIRNCIVHNSDSANVAYRKSLQSTYGITAAPGPDEFLHAKDNTKSSPKRYCSRVLGIAEIVSKTIQRI